MPRQDILSRGSILKEFEFTQHNGTITRFTGVTNSGERFRLDLKRGLTVNDYIMPEDIIPNNRQVYAEVFTFYMCNIFGDEFYNKSSCITPKV